MQGKIFNSSLVIGSGQHGTTLRTVQRGHAYVSTFPLRDMASEGETWGETFGDWEARYPDAERAELVRFAAAKPTPSESRKSYDWYLEWRLGDGADRKLRARAAKVKDEKFVTFGGRTPLGDVVSAPPRFLCPRRSYAFLRSCSWRARGTTRRWIRRATSRSSSRRWTRRSAPTTTLASLSSSTAAAATAGPTRRPAASCRSSSRRRRSSPTSTRSGSGTCWCTRWRRGSAGSRAVSSRCSTSRRATASSSSTARTATPPPRPRPSPPTSRAAPPRPELFFYFFQDPLPRTLRGYRRFYS